MNHDESNERDELWHLLGKAREPKVSPFFASKVMRAIREEHEEREAAPRGAWWRFSLRWLVPTAAAAACAVVAFVAMRPTTPVVDSVAKMDPMLEMASVAAVESELSPALDELIAVEDHSIWLQADPSSLY